MRRQQTPGLAVLGVLLAGAAAFGPLGCSRGPSSSPSGSPAGSARGADVILVTIDTLRADAVGFAGNERVETPVLDRLAAAGRVYTDAHAHNVVTLPSHTNILTGLYPYQHGVRDNSGFELPASVPTLATLLRQAGYATGAFVGAYPLDARFGLNQGFDVYDDRYPLGSNPDEFVIAERRGDAVVTAALAWWNQARGQAQERPRFLWVHLYDPHAGYEPPEPFASRFRDSPYHGEVSAADSFLAPLLEPHLSGKERPALIVMTADHGESLGEHGEMTHGLFAYEPTLKVPLVVWGPGVEPGKDGRSARHVDIVPTVLGALGLDAPKELPGRSLLAAAQPGDSYFESLTTNLNRGWAPLRGLLRERRKLIDLPVPELYDLAKDPREEDNRFAAERRTARELLTALPKESVWPPEKGTVSPEEEARLRSLGYSAGSERRKASYTPEDDPKKLAGLDRKIHEVIDLYSRNRFAEAAALAREVVQARPTMAEGYEHLALSLRQLERHGEAIEALREGVRRAGGKESLQRQLGLALSEAGRAREAVEVLQPLGGGTDSATLNALGIALSDSGRNPEAADVLRRAVERYPTDPKGYENLGIVLLRMQRAAEARDALRKAIDINPSLPIAWNTLGVALYRLEGPASALAAWEQSVALDSSQYDALYNMGWVAMEAGRPLQARQALARFIQTAPPQRFGPEIQKARELLARLGGYSGAR
ncbi:MAG TPA: sulfatase-like hydrolase/transferase [Thermoanaerobaculia bacterium]